MKDSNYLMQVLAELYQKGYENGMVHEISSPLSDLDHRVQSHYVAYEKLAKRFGVEIPKSMTEHPSVKALLEMRRRK